jgi:hypothetical protein
LISYYQLQIWWNSPKTKKQEMVFAKDLLPDQLNNLLGRIENRQDWSELKSLIEKHEEQKISYVVEGLRRSGNTYILSILVHGVKNAV